MISKKNSAMGIVFPNSFDDLVPALVNRRLMASIPFAGRYRMIDFVISSMSNCGIHNISMVVRKNHYSLLDHLGAGKEWDLTRRRGGLNILPPFGEKNPELYEGRIAAFVELLEFLESQKERYVIFCDTNLAINFDFNNLISTHSKSGADVTIVYQKTEIPKELKKSNYTLTTDENGKVEEILFNDFREGVQNLSMNIYIMERETLIRRVRNANMRGMVSFERDVLARNLDILNVHAVEYTGYVARISSLKSYFDENMKLIEENNLDYLFPSTSPIYTKTRDDNPTRYVNGSHVESSLIADGCVIKGRVENSILFRGVVVEKGTTVRNCILMQDTHVGKYVNLECVIADKNVVFTDEKQLFGTESFPVFVGKKQKV